MELSEGYRRSRRTTSWLCAVGFAWSTAQVEIRSVDIGGTGLVDLSSASIPLVISAGVVYSIVRTTLEFAMQPVDIRRWRLAHIDYMLTLTLVRATLLMVAASGLYRSATMMIVVAAGVLVFLIVSALLMTVAMFIAMPIVTLIRERQERSSVAAASFEASYWSGGIVIVLMISALAWLGNLSLTYEPLYQLWPSPPSAWSVAVTVGVASAVVISYVLFEGRLHRKLFDAEDAQPPAR